MNQLRVPKEDAYKRYESLLDLHPHEQRVMGLHFDNINDVLYTCSEDKLLKVIEGRETTHSMARRAMIVRGV